MTHPTIDFEVRDHIARLALNRPDTGNAADLLLVRELLQITTAISEDPSIRVVLLTGAGRNFCVGGDLKSFSEEADLGAHLAEVTSCLHSAVSLLAHLPAPVIAAVQGSAAGAGMSIACGADLLLMASSARLIFAYSRVGLTPDGGGSWYLPRLVGMRRALDIALTNRVISAQEALEWGLVTRVVPDDQLSAEAEALALTLAQGSRAALADAKRLLRGSLANDLETQLALETQALSANAEIDGREGIDAFITKRAPRFGT